MNSIHLKKILSSFDVGVKIPGSKSESNRALIIQANTNGNSSIKNLSSARDTKTMIKLLNSDEDELDVLDAGTTMRFLLAHFAVKNKNILLTGTPRMQQRPIHILVDALNQLGANISYQKKEGFPPLQIHPFKSQKSKGVSVQSNISSQYISALLMIAPTLKEGLILSLVGKVSSRPYIDMTMALMNQAGVEVDIESNTYSVEPQKYKPFDFSIEPDWSGASYWYSLVSLTPGSKVDIPGLRSNSFQGDSIISKIMDQLGVETDFYEGGAMLINKPAAVTEFNYDFSDCPDLFQTISVCLAVQGIPGKFTGLHSLKIKETDRTFALQKELAKVGAELIEEGEVQWKLKPSTTLPENIQIKTYDDHRMAMAFAPLISRMDVSFDDSTVVNKSYPEFWEEIQKTGTMVLQGRD